MVIVTAARVLQLARTQLGVVEAPDGSTMYHRVYGLPYSQPWCAVFLWWLFRTAGGPELIHPKTAYTPTLAQWFVDRKQWHKTPQVGDLVFFNWPDGIGRIQHVGIVESVEPGAVVTIEANTSDASASNGGAVLRRRRARNSSIAGYGRPAYTRITVGDPAPTSGMSVTSTTARPVAELQPRLTAGPAVNASVRAVQVFAARYAPGYPGVGQLAADGVYGDLTVRWVAEFQRRSGLTGPEFNGRAVGLRTWAALIDAGYRPPPTVVRPLLAAEPAPPTPKEAPVALEIRPVPVRDAFRSVASARQFLGSLLAILVGFGVLTNVQGDALDGLIGAVPGLITLAMDVWRSFQVRAAVEAAESQVTPLESPAVVDADTGLLVPLVRIDA